MTNALKSHRLLLMEIHVEHDVVLCRQRAREYAELLGFTSQGQIRMATALSEVARNAFQYAGGARVEFSLETEPRFASPHRPQQRLVIVVSDTGPGIPNLDEILAGNYRSETGLGLGIIGARRLMDRVDIETSPRGTTVAIRQTLPPTAPLTQPAQIAAMVDELARRPAPTAIQEMQVQNQELIRAVDDARLRQEEINRINDELAETNSGVLALYDELETLHRVSVLLASQLELKPLIQSMIDVTTDLTNAHLGAFYFRAESGETWLAYATAGPARESLVGLPALEGDYFGPDFGRTGLSHIADLSEQVAPCSASRFAQALESRFNVHSCLVVPIAASGDNVLGAMVFASSEPNRFTERSERIVASIAAQAAIGIEKSRLYQSVKASNEAKDRFLAMLSHELRTPLNPVLATVSSWHGDPRIPEELREEVAMVARNVRLEARLIDDLLDFNKLINGKLQIDHLAVDLHSVVTTTVDICRDDLELQGQVLKVELGARECRVAGDAARLQQVLWNVLKNAIKFTGKGGAITVVTSNPDPGTIRTEIVDNGRGIDPDSLGRIFGAFEQGQPQVLARFGGLGLGLAIAKTFVERHGGTIVATSLGEGHGSQFTIDLPLDTSPILSLPLSATSSLKPLPTRSARILLVEDHTDTLLTLSRLLGRKGFLVTQAPTGAEARQQFSAATFDLIISDLGLPDCSGLELLGELRAVATVPAIALSGYGMESDLVSSKVAGFDAHLTKPIDFESLIRTVDQLLAEN